MQIVYILINEAMPGYVKVGRTASDLVGRIKALDTTGVPLPFECFYAAEVTDGAEVERRLHDAFDNNRVRSSREFFEIDPERIASALKLAEVNDVTPRFDVVETQEDQVALNEARSRRHSTNFRMLDVPPGSVLTFTKDPSKTCVVEDSKKVLYEGESLSASESALRALHSIGYTWSTVNGYTFWEYEGETLTERRYRIEKGEY